MNALRKGSIPENMLKRTLALGLAGMMAVLGTACGKSEGQKSGGGNGVSEYTYVPEYVDLNLENKGEDTYINLYNARLLEGDLYFTSNTYDGTTNTNTFLLHDYSLEQGKEVKSWDLSFSGSQEENVSYDIRAWDLFSDDTVLCIGARSEMAEEDYKQEYFFRVYDANSNLVKEEQLTGQLPEEYNDQMWIDKMVVDGDNRIYVASDSNILLFGPDLKYAGAVECGDWINGICEGKDGRIYISQYDRGGDGDGFSLYAVDFEKRALGDKYENFISGNNGMYAGGESDFLVSDSSYVYGYDLKSKTYETMFSWIDSDISGDTVQGIFPMEDGRLAVVINDWEGDGESVALLTKTKTSELAQKETIVLASLYPDSQYTSQIVEFNKHSDKYRITLKSYYDTNSRSEDSYNDAIMALNNDLISSNPPDIVGVDSMQNLASLAAKGVFEDLNGYLEKSSVVKKEDIFENIINANTYGGKLLCIPRTFSIITICGKTSVVGGKRGWTIDDMIALAEAHPDSQMFNYVTKENMLYYMVAFNSESFINYETGECNFNSDGFKKILELANTFPAEADYEEDEQEMLASGKSLLYETYLSDFNEIQVPEAMFGEPVTFIGFPTIDGSNGSVLMADGGFAITAKSDKKEGAWAFIEDYLTGGSERYSWGYSSMKSKFEEQAKEAMKVEYVTDENGEFLLDENGEKIPENGGGGFGIGNFSYTYHVCTEEEANLAREIINESTKSVSVDENLLNILAEEAAPYFAGQKGVDEVADIIQSRIKIYINE